MPSERTRILSVPPYGSFLAREYLDAETITKLVREHQENQDPARLLKSRFGTIVTRVPWQHPDGPDSRSASDRPSEVVVKEVPTPGRRTILYRLGMRSRFCGDFSKWGRLQDLGVLSPPVLACSLRPHRRREFQLTAYVDGGRTLRELLWLGEDALAPSGRQRLLEFTGRWLQKVHDVGIWQRDLKPHNLILRRWHDTTPEVQLLDTTAVRLLGRPLDEERRIKNLGQILDVPARLDAEAAGPLLRGYLEKRPDLLERWDSETAAVVEQRRRHRQRVDGFRYIDMHLPSEPGYVPPKEPSSEP
jgi:tRNA A-37 threonylcarbamoyl transferase component Bud32